MAATLSPQDDLLLFARAFVMPYAELDEKTLSQAAHLKPGDVLRIGGLVLTPHIALSIIAARDIIAKAEAA